MNPPSSRWRSYTLAVLAFFVLAQMLTVMPVSADTYAILREFAGSADDGGVPNGSLILSGSTLYGMTPQGGDSGAGTIFSINTDGTGFTLLHEFTSDADDGGFPVSSLTISGSTLYGMTPYGGDSSAGTIFSINTDGTGFTLLHEFAGGADDGRYPIGSLTLSGSTLYGATPYGGDSDLGTIFSINTDGTGFTLLHEFAGGADDGQAPYYGPLVLSGSTLYGMTWWGGDSDLGTIFSINTDGTGFTLLYEFPGGSNNAAHPRSPLTLFGSKLYGMASFDNSNDREVIFSINTDGTGFTPLYELADWDDDGWSPHGSLTPSDSMLYGTRMKGGNSECGTIFSINTDGTGFTLLREFVGGADDGCGLCNSLVLSGSTLYGMTSRGGDSDAGTIFSYAFSTPTPTPTRSRGSSGSYLSSEQLAKLFAFPSPSAAPTPLVSATPSMVPLVMLTPPPSPSASVLPSVSVTPTLSATPSPSVSATPILSVSVAPAPSPSVTRSLPSAGEVSSVATSVAAFSATVAALALFFALVNLSRTGVSRFNLFGFALQSLWQVVGVKKKSDVWGTVYDSATKKGIPYAKLELLDSSNRVLEIRYTDRDGRYGFLVNPKGLTEKQISVHLNPRAHGYRFPSTNISASATDFIVYDYVYTGGDLTVTSEDVINANIPLDPESESLSHTEYAPIIPAALASSGLNLLFWIGLIAAPLALYLRPTRTNLIILTVFLLVNGIRALTSLYRPFGVVRDSVTRRPLPYALVELIDPTGRRITFSVSDEHGRYFLVTSAGTYLLRLHTSANTVPARTATIALTTKRGWISKKLTV